MDLGNPWSLISGLFISLIGMAVLMYGKKQCRPMCMAAGCALCAIPYFISSVLALWVVAACCVGLLYLTAEPA